MLHVDYQASADIHGLVGPPDRSQNTRDGHCPHQVLGGGLLGDVNSVGDGIHELRIHIGAGWRAYSTRRAGQVIILLAGGSKRTQKTDIRRAKDLAARLEDWIMTTKHTRSRKKTGRSGIKAADLPVFDAAACLDDEQTIAAYLTDILEAQDPALLEAALGDMARARGMTEIAKASGITREALYKALRSDAQPRFDTISRVCAALGVRLVAEPA